jgi:hypothetical protein
VARDLLTSWRRRRCCTRTGRLTTHTMRCKTLVIVGNMVTLRSWGSLSRTSGCLSKGSEETGGAECVFCGGSYSGFLYCEEQAE